MKYDPTMTMKMEESTHPPPDLPTVVAAVRNFARRHPKVMTPDVIADLEQSLTRLWDRPAED